MKLRDVAKDRSARRKAAAQLRDQYASWKKEGLKGGGWFPIFNGFKHAHLKSLSGNALRLYLYFGLHGKQETGESWHDIETIAEFFEKSPRAIKLWIQELEEAGLIERIQMSANGVAFTYLVPYRHERRLMPGDEEEPENIEVDTKADRLGPPTAAIGGEAEELMVAALMDKLAARLADKIVIDSNVIKAYLQGQEPQPEAPASHVQARKLEEGDGDKAESK